MFGFYFIKLVGLVSSTMSLGLPYLGCFGTMIIRKKLQGWNTSKNLRG
jgi:hypothetical protein